MAGPAFDPNGAVRFDLEKGAASDAGGARLLLLPSSALQALGTDVLGKLGRELGRACGARVATRLGGDTGVRGATIEVAASHLAGELAIAGVGAIHLERWGRAMVVVVANPSVADDAFVSEVLGGALSAASGREIAAALLSREGGTARYFLGSATTAERVRGLVAQRMGHAEILAALQGGSS